MTNRERIVATLRGEKTDRVPFGVGLGFWPWGETLQRWQRESGLKDLDLAGHFGYDPDFRVVPVEYGPWPHCPAAVIREDAEFIVSTEFRGMTWRNRRDGHSMPEFIAHPIKSADDWRRYRDERLQPHLEQRLARLDEFAAQMAALDAPVQLGCFPWGVFGTARDLLGAEEILIGFYTQPELIRDIMATYTKLWLSLFEPVAAAVRVDHIHIWEDMAGRQGSLISMTMVEDFMMPHYDRIAEFAKRHGIPLISVDSDGRVDELVPVMMRHGVNAYLPFEVQAGSDIEEFRRLYPRLGIIGGLDKNALADEAPPAAMHRELDRAARLLEHGGYIPGCDHLIPPNVPWKKWCDFLGQLRRLTGA
ncbi:MAG: methylcobalamin:coenzyme M methyltransferase [Lentisphaerae bacterium ADurb.BinA184]|nr:MAG: methylcobalamin:coenzyme M methyltransferase [Lentisphaerae bacterium ADurb.BinA184]